MARHHAVAVFCGAMTELMHLPGAAFRHRLPDRGNSAGRRTGPLLGAYRKPLSSHMARAARRTAALRG